MTHNLKPRMENHQVCLQFSKLSCFTEPRWIAYHWNLSIPFVRSAIFFFFYRNKTKDNADDEERDVVAPLRRQNPPGRSTLFNFARRSWNGIPADRRGGGPFVIRAQWLICERSLRFLALPEEDPKTLPRRTDERGGGDGRLCASSMCDLCDDSSPPTHPSM